MKNQHKREWSICKMTVFLFVMGTIFGNAQTPMTPKNGYNSLDIKGKEIDSTLKSGDFPDIVQTGHDRITSDNNKVYTVIEKMPEFPGGEYALCSFIAKNIHYPPMDGCGNPGKVIIRFIITKSGDVSHIEVIRSFDPAYDKEAITVIKKLPRWIPGEHNGKKVDVYYTIPIAFRLQ